MCDDFDVLCVYFVCVYLSCYGELVDGLFGVVFIGVYLFID